VERTNFGCFSVHIPETPIFHLVADEKDRETIERVNVDYAVGCPVARSIKDSIEITSKLGLTIG